MQIEVNERKAGKRMSREKGIIGRRNRKRSITKESNREREGVQRERHTNILNKIKGAQKEGTVREVALREGSSVEDVLYVATLASLPAVAAYTPYLP